MCFKLTNFGFTELSGSVWKSVKTRKELYGIKISYWEFSVSCELVEYSIFFHSLGVTLKNRSKVKKKKKRSESVKNDTKAGITKACPLHFASLFFSVKESIFETTTMVIREFLMFYQIFLSPQVKRSLIISNKLV